MVCNCPFPRFALSFVNDVVKEVRLICRGMWCILARTGPVTNGLPSGETRANFNYKTNASSRAGLRYSKAACTLGSTT